MNLGRCSVCGSRLSHGRDFQVYCSECNRRSKQRVFTQLPCPRTGKDENQYVVRESEDGITLRCGGCNKHHSHEIGRFAHLFNQSSEQKADSVYTDKKKEN